MRERTGGRVVLPTSTLYRGVERLLTGGLIADYDEPQAEASGGPPRRLYRITNLGRQTAEAEAQRLREVMLLAESRFLSPRSSR